MERNGESDDSAEDASEGIARFVLGALRVMTLVAGVGLLVFGVLMTSMGYIFGEGCSRD